ncbi:hypothetical protein C8J48_2205 [Desmospora activa DSM 45169]|uniref:Uncharacterized protein n=1 Tax=Desmospora activa DSM 45169 TaxID=1121389 RepID=A0A2T4ZCF4_9BACL|nr:hypothetical protein C8J48_2205 [Desmospora activa DSM 45169]
MVVGLSFPGGSVQAQAQDSVREFELNKQKGQPEVHQGEYVFLHNKGNSFQADQINDKIPGSLKIEEQKGHQSNLVGVGLYKRNGKVHTDFF